MSLGEGAVGELVVTFYASDPDRIKSFEEVVGYSSSPVFSFANGGHWLAYLCREPTPEEKADYWKRRAITAEAKVLATEDVSG